MASLLKDVTLVGPAGEQVPASTLEGKVLAFYFSASWCGPCQSFTPKLAEYYESFKANHAEKDRFEVIFMSSDRDEDSFNTYRKKMPWPALPLNHPLKKELAMRYGVRGIPCLVFVDADGATLNTQGRAAIVQDPEAEEWPYSPKSFEEVLGDSFVKADGTLIDQSHFNDKYIGLYFSAHWCPPCRDFTPHLAKVYENLQAQGKPFEVIYVPADRTEDQFNEYIQEMPWFAVPFEDQSRRHALLERMGVQGFPTLVILSPERLVVNGQGRTAVAADDENGSEFPWAPKPFLVLSESTVADLNADPFLLVLLEDEAAVTAATPLLQAVAKDEEAAAKADGHDALRIMAADVDGEVTGFIRDFLNLEDEAPQLVVLNVPKQGKFRVPSTDLSRENLDQLLADYRADRIQYGSLKA